MARVVNSIGILGLEGYLINVEVSVYSGLAMTSIVGGWNDYKKTRSDDKYLYVSSLYDISDAKLNKRIDCGRLLKCIDI